VTGNEIDMDWIRQIVTNDTADLLSFLNEAELKNVTTNISSLLKSQRLPEKRIDDLVWLYSCIPKYAGKIIELGQQVEAVAEKHGIEFKDLILEVVHANFGAPIEYNKEAPDYRYLIDAIQTIGGYACSRKSREAIQKSLQNHTEFQSVTDPDCVIDCGIKKIRESLKQYRDVSEELSDRILSGRHPMPMQGYGSILDMTPQAATRENVTYKKK
jgi:hypothetical protein